MSTPPDSKTGKLDLTLMVQDGLANIKAHMTPEARRAAEKQAEAISVQLGLMNTADSPLGEKASPQARALMAQVIEKEKAWQSVYHPAKIPLIVMKELAGMEQLAKDAGNDELIQAVRNVSVHYMNSVAERSAGDGPETPHPGGGRPLVMRGRKMPR